MLFGCSLWQSDTYNGTVVNEAGCIVRILQPELIVHLSRPIDGVRDDIPTREPCGLVAEHDQLIREWVVLWMCRERLCFDLTERVITGRFQRLWVDGVRLATKISTSYEKRLPGWRSLTSPPSFSARR